MLHLPHQLWGAAGGLESREAPPRPFPSNFTKLPGSPGGVPSSKGLARGPGSLALGDGAGGADANTHTRHLLAAPGDTKSYFATPPCSPRAGGHPHPAPARPKGAPQRSGGVRGAQLGDSRPAPPGASAVTLGGGAAPGCPGCPLRGRRFDARPALATGAESPPQRCKAPSQGSWSPRSLPSFLGKPGAGCAHPRSETEHRRGAAAAKEAEGGHGGDREASAPVRAKGRCRPLAPLSAGAG